WFLSMMFILATTSTIPTGALAERWKFASFFIFCLFVGGLLYPIYGCWLWGGGWLAQLGQSGIGHGAVDYAGSSVVHMQGGVLALTCAFLLGPRIGKYDSNGKPKTILGHNIPMVILGTFILAFGWLGFNATHLIAKGATGLFGFSEVATYTGDLTKLPTGFSEIGVTGLLYGNAKQFFAECIAGVSCFTWNAIASGIVFIIIGKVLGGN